MSSTKRGGQRHVSDYYVTPKESIRDFFNEFLQHEPDALSGDGTILDPCAGGDSKNEMSYPTVLCETGVEQNRIITVDIREDSEASIKGDYFKMNFPKDKPVRIVISNPPFSDAQEFILKGLSEVETGGFVIMLLRLNFFGGVKRNPLWRERTPKYAFVHPRRMSFTADGKTDSIEYMHCVWQKGCETEFTRLIVLPTTQNK